MSTKKRILMVNEGSHLFTGFSTYGKEVLTRLFNTGKYELAEFASFTDVGAAQANKSSIPWKVYPNHVPDTDPRHPSMKLRGDGVFGAWRLDRVLLDFKPDIVFDIRDYWMLAFENNTALRPFFHWAIMPTVDSAPQHEAWLETFMQADSVLTYSDWGKEILEDEGGGKINVVAVASPGVDLDVFKPIANKQAHRDRMGLSGDINILGTVMRNQKRKLYPELFESFAKFIELAISKGRLDIAQKTFLYAHTSYPDNGWSIPSLLKEHGLCHKVLFTYVCTNCGHYFPAFFQDARSICKKCHHTTALLSSTHTGLNRAQLANIYNMFDAYIQYSICEGFGMPQVEAISCGLPLFTVGYSAMTEVGKKSGGEVIPYKTKFLELETGAYRVYPDNDYTVNAIYKFFTKPAPMRAKHGFSARQCAEKFYNWDTVAKIWENHFDSIELTGLQGKWDTPTKIHYPEPAMPPNHDTWQNEQFTKWLVTKVLGKPELVYSHFAMELTRALNYGIRKTGENYEKVTRADVFNSMLDKAMSETHVHEARLGYVNLMEQDFIKVANE